MKSLDHKKSTGLPINYRLFPLHGIRALVNQTQHRFCHLLQEDLTVIMQILDDIDQITSKFIKVREWSTTNLMNHLTDSERQILHQFVENFDNFIANLKYKIRNAVIDARSRQLKIPISDLKKDMEDFSKLEFLHYKLSNLNYLQNYNVKLIAKSSAWNTIGTISSIVLVCKWEQLESFRFKFDKIIKEKTKPCAFIDLDLVSIEDKFSTQPGLYNYKDRHFTMYTEPTIPNFHVTPPTTLKSSHNQTEDIPTILLMGETGVGKSTFINSLANFFAFKTFDGAVSSQNVFEVIPSLIEIHDVNNKEHRIATGELTDLDFIRYYYKLQDAKKLHVRMD